MFDSFDKLRETLSGLADKGRAAARLVRKKVPVGSTPADVVYRANKLSLLRYRRTPLAAELAGEGSDRPSVPILFVPSLINRHYILDLMPGRSLVEYLVAQGFDVYMIDWGKPGPEDRYITFDDYIGGLLHRVVRRTAELAGGESVTLVGYCMGGTLAVIHAALAPTSVRNLVTFASPVDFSEGGILSQWTSGQRFDPNLVVDAFGNVPWQLMQASFHMLVPTLWAQKALFLYDKLGDESFEDNFLALETWGNDNVSFPGECYRRYIHDLYQENLLVRDELYVAGRLAKLSSIGAPLLNVLADGDHIVPAACAAALSARVGSTDKELWQLPGGHIGAIVSRTAARRFWPTLTTWLRPRSS